MLFQIIKDGKVKGQCKRKEDMPSKAVLLNMKANGYTFKLDGRPFTVKKGSGDIHERSRI